MKKRSWMRRSGMILSAFVSMAAPAKAEGVVIGKKSKPDRKTKASAHHVAAGGDDAADSRPPFAKQRPHPQPPPPLQMPTKPSLASELAEARRRVSDLKGQSFKLPTATFTKYPWKTDIATTVFWIGEKATEKNPVPNHASSWDPKWATSYGGFDDPDPDMRSGYLPVKFTPKQNPFYVALPYNDITAQGHKSEARQVVPWFKEGFTGNKFNSVCKGRWIAIRKGNKVCYAQWEDVGPFNTDDAGYVFGSQPPKPNNNKNAGLDVSPAVRDFLGLNGMDTTDWRFVDFEEVPAGPWAEHGDNNHFVIAKKKAEQKALAFSEMAARKGGS